jgi:hypothetical protein
MLRSRRLAGPPAWRRTLLVLHGYILPSASFHLLDIGAVLERLREVADVAVDVLVAVEGEGEDGLFVVPC